MSESYMLTNSKTMADEWGRPGRDDEEDEDLSEEEILFVPPSRHHTTTNELDPPSSISSHNPSSINTSRNRREVFDTASLREALPSSPSDNLDRFTLQPGRRRRKVLAVLDLNGLLFFREKIEQTPKGIIPHAQVGTFNVWDRRHSETFLDFMFDTFDIGVWSSARQENVVKLVERTFGAGRMSALVFMWDQSYCTVEKRKPRPLFAKDLKKVWTAFPQYVNGNTFLLDDDEEKAKHNPPYTGIHPKEWTRFLPQDDKLGPDGPIRLYLRALSNALQSDHELTAEAYIEQHPFIDDGDRGRN